MSCAKRDAVLITLAAVPAFLAAVHFDLFELVHAFTRSHEEWQLDEIVAAAFIVGLSSIVYSVRRLSDLNREVKQRRVAEHTAVQLALHDTLTGLANRQKFDRLLSSRVLRGDLKPRAILVINVDGFKQVNDAYGHRVGDDLLLEVGERLSAICEDEGFVARLGGDEFAMASGVIRHDVDVIRLARRVIGAAEATFSLRGNEIGITVSVGIARFPSDGRTSDELLRRADVALRCAKLTGRSNFSFYEEAMDHDISRRGRIENRLRAAIAEDVIVPYFQPIVNLMSGKTVAFESLARWNDPELGWVPPDQFIPIAEDCGLIGPLSERLMRLACGEALRWPADIRLSFNLSGVQLKERMLGLKVLSILGELGLDPRQLELEITESALVKDVVTARETLDIFTQTGICIALDDFGTGHSSLRYIREFPIHKLKIDQSFVRTMEAKVESDQIVRAILGLAQGLALETTAEGIEDESHMVALQRLGCTYGQGYYFGKPMPAGDVMRFLETEEQRLSA